MAAALAAAAVAAAAAPQCTYENDTDYMVTPSSMHGGVWDPEGCCEICYNDTVCTFYTYAGGGVCWFHEAVGERQHSPGHTSGSCGKTPTPPAPPGKPTPAPPPAPPPPPGPSPAPPAPPTTPAPTATPRPWMDASKPPLWRAHALVAAMTTEEKLGLFHGSCHTNTGNVCGNSRLGIPKINLNDGPQGVRGTAGTATSWPAELTVTATFDDDLARMYGEAMGDEFYRKGANVQLGPGACIARVPEGGRNFEYASGEDPYLGYRMVAAMVTGIQSQGVIATVKHYANNNQENNRFMYTADVDERTEFEIYYPPFEGAVSAGVGAVMCSYNKICKDCPAGTNGTFACENPDTLQRDLKDRLGFKGWVMSDWGATHSVSMNAGLDMEMPDAKFLGDTLQQMVQNGTVTMGKVNDSASRILWPLFAVGAFDKLQPKPVANATTAAHNALARNISAASTVLLKNDNLLPIGSEVKNIAVIGREAAFPTTHTPSGSGYVEGYYTIAPLQALRARLGIPPRVYPNNCSEGGFQYGVGYNNGDGQTTAQAGTPEECCALCAQQDGCNAFTLRPDIGVCFMKADANNPGPDSLLISGICKKGPNPPGDCQDGRCVRHVDGSNVSAAVELAEAADVVLVFVATNSAEGSDRGLDLGNQDTLIEAVAKASGNKTAVIAVAPGAILTPWRDSVAAILTPMLPGQEYGNAIADVLVGDVTPGGKLPVTFPSQRNEMNLTQSQYPGINGIAEYSERLEVGYRWYAAHRVKPAYPFGHGLSYTTFEYSNLHAENLKVQCEVRNVGKMRGSEVAQLYLEFPTTAGEPPKQLKGYQKIDLVPGDSKLITFQLNNRSFSIWDLATHAWSIARGDFGVMVGSSSEDIRLTGTLSTV